MEIAMDRRVSTVLRTGGLCPYPIWTSPRVYVSRRMSMHASVRQSRPRFLPRVSSSLRLSPVLQLGSMRTLWVSCCNPVWVAKPQAFELNSCMVSVIALRFDARQ
jgi:hypothetical protein